MKDEDFAYAGNGLFTKISDASGPYGKRAPNDYYLMEPSSGGGGVAPGVDVLGTVVDSLAKNTSKPANGDTVQIILDKLSTFDNAFETEVRAVSLIGITFNNSTDLTASDEIVHAFGKLQAQIKALPEAELARLLNTPLSLVADTENPEADDKFGALLNKIYHFMREHSSKTMSATSYGLLKDGEFPSGNKEFLSTDRLVTTLNKAIKHIKDLEAKNAKLNAGMKDVYSELGWNWTEE